MNEYRVKIDSKIAESLCGHADKSIRSASVGNRLLKDWCIAMFGAKNVYCTFEYGSSETYICSFAKLEHAVEFYNRFINVNGALHIFSYTVEQVPFILDYLKDVDKTKYQFGNLFHSHDERTLIITDRDEAIKFKLSLPTSTTGAK